MNPFTLSAIKNNKVVDFYNKDDNYSLMVDGFKNTNNYFKKCNINFSIYKENVDNIINIKKL